MIKELKNIIEKVITMKGNEVMENNFSDMTGAERADHDESLSKSTELRNSLKDILTKEQLKVVDDCIDAEILVSTLEQRYMFNRGVKMGLTELRFIREELGSSIVLL